MVQKSASAERFDAWLRRRAKRAAFRVAAEIGVDESYVSHLRAGRRVPSLRVAALIEKLTRGRVRANGWVGATRVAA